MLREDLRDAIAMNPATTSKLRQDGRSLVIGLTSAAVNGGVLVWMALSPHSRVLPFVPSMVALALGIGALLGLLVGRRHFLAAGIGALAGMLLVWTPVVMVTFGIALAATPFFLAYAALVGLGTLLAGRRRSATSGSLPPAA